MIKHVKKRGTPRSNPETMIRYAMWGAAVVGGIFLYKKFAPSAKAASGASTGSRTSQLDAAMAQGALPASMEPARYHARKRGGGTVCIDGRTGQIVPNSRCEREMLAGLGGIFG